MKKTIATIALMAAAYGGMAQGHTTVLEEFSTAKCQYCPRGAEEIRRTIEGRDDVLWIVHHAGFMTDDITTPASSNLTYLYGGTTFAPAIMFDRTTPTEHQNGNSPVLNLGDSTYIADLIEEIASYDHFTTLYLTDLYYDESTRRFRGMVSGRVYQEFDTANTRLSVYIVEDSIVLSQASESGYIKDYIHMHAVRASITESLGTELEFDEDGSYMFIFDNMLPSKIVSRNARLVALLHGYSRGELDNNRILASGSTRSLTSPLLSIDEATPATELTIYPNPATLRVTVEAESTIESLIVTDAAGRIVHRAPKGSSRAYTIDVEGWAPGIYAAQVSTANGTSTQLIIKQ